MKDNNYVVVPSEGLFATRVRILFGPKEDTTPSHGSFSTRMGQAPRIPLPTRKIKVCLLTSIELIKQRMNLPTTLERRTGLTVLPLSSQTLKHIIPSSSLQHPYNKPPFFQEQGQTKTPEHKSN